MTKSEPGSHQSSNLLRRDPKRCAKIVELRTVHKLTVQALSERFVCSPALIKQILTEAKDGSAQLSS